jgi:sortase A
MSGRLFGPWRRRALLGVALVLGVAGIWQVGAAGWIHAKALVAQVLLERAWQQTDGQSAVEPWPWADTVPVARLQAPDHDVDQIVLAGATGESLAFGPAKLAASAAPGTGPTVIAGHRDTHFRFLEHVNAGDRLVLRRRDGERRRYRVTAREVVDSRDHRLSLSGADRLTLVTCYPFDAVEPGGPMRLVVVAEPVGRG